MNVSIKGKKLHTVQHYQQQDNWDCGFACVIMLLDDVKQRSWVIQNIEQICQEEGFDKSTWTIDLCYLLKRFGKRFFYTTTTLGVDPGYSSQGFYSRILSKDEDRVNRRFQEAKDRDIVIKKRSCDITEILSHLRDSGPCIVLTNANILSCSEPIISCGGSCFTKTCIPNYQGHYVLAVGYDMDNRTILIRNPSVRNEVSQISFACFEEARTSYGTDEDIIFVFIGDSK